MENKLLRKGRLQDSKTINTVEWKNRNSLFTLFILIQFTEGFGDAGSEQLKNAFNMMHKWSMEFWGHVGVKSWCGSKTFGWLCRRKSIESAIKYIYKINTNKSFYFRKSQSTGGSSWGKIHPCHILIPFLHLLVLAS